MILFPDIMPGSGDPGIIFWYENFNLFCRKGVGAMTYCVCLVFSISTNEILLHYGYHGAKLNGLSYKYSPGLEARGAVDCVKEWLDIDVTSSQIHLVGSSRIGSNDLLRLDQAKDCNDIVDYYVLFLERDMLDLSSLSKKNLIFLSMSDFEKLAVNPDKFLNGSTTIDMIRFASQMRCNISVR